VADVRKGIANQTKPLARTLVAPREEAQRDSIFYKAKKKRCCVFVINDIHDFLFTW
jgi:hypothetical protein